MKDDRGYTIELDVKFGFLELIDVPSLVAARKDRRASERVLRVGGGCRVYKPLIIVAFC